MHAIDAYARAVVTGQVPAGKYHRLACERHERDRAREGTAGFPYRLDLARADRFCRFAEKLRHYKGEWAGQFIRLQPHQVFRLGSLFGWVHAETGLRRFRVAYFEIPRKNGKSLEAAVVVLYAVFFDQEPGAEGYCIATKRAQAKIVFNDCKRLVRSSGLRARIRVLMANLHRELTASKLEPLGADHDSTDGLNPHVVVIDEAHALKNRGMIDVMETAVGARRQPLIFWITTAGNDPVTPCGDQHHYACQILDQVITDETSETVFAFIAHAEEHDDWSDEATWRKANPSYGVCVKPEDLRAQASKALHMPAAAAAFRQKRCNLWVQALTPWLSLDGWRAGQSRWPVEELHGEPCWIGIDMSSKIDLTAMVCVFPPTATRARWRLVVRCLTPAATLLERAKRDRAPYPQWVDRGWLFTNPGNRIDQDVIRDWVWSAAAVFDVQGVGVDPWNAGNLVNDLQEPDRDDVAPLVVAEVPQNIAQMSAPSKEFEADVLDGIVDAGGHELMQWCVSNVVVFRDNKDNIYPIKKKSRGRIDPVIAALIGRKLAMLDTAEPIETDPELVVA